MPARLPARVVSEYLSIEPPEVRRVVRALRAAILKAAPTAAEAIKFDVLCYYHADAFFGAIGGNICMIEIKRGKVLLSFLHGAQLPDPNCLLQGTQKVKRHLLIPDAAFAKSPAVARLIRVAAKLRPWA